MFQARYSEHFDGSRPHKCSNCKFTRSENGNICTTWRSQVQNLRQARKFPTKWRKGDLPPTHKTLKRIPSFTQLHKRQFLQALDSFVTKLTFSKRKGIFMQQYPDTMVFADRGKLHLAHWNTVCLFSTWTHCKATGTFKTGWLHQGPKVSLTKKKMSPHADPNYVKWPRAMCSCALDCKKKLVAQSCPTPISATGGKSGSKHQRANDVDGGHDDTSVFIHAG